VFVGAERTAGGHTLLGMNWEWRPEVLDFRVVLIARCTDALDHIVVTECGQPGKYGVNAQGIAAIETSLGCSQQLGVGDNLFAVVVRQVLAQTNLPDARQVVLDHPPEATVSFFIADDSGHGLNVEATPHGLSEKRLQPDEICWHTNHCLLTDEPSSFADSFVRGRRWAELIRHPGPVTWQTVRRWLADTENGANAICKAPDPALAHTITWLQTLCSIVIDPHERALWVSDGLSAGQPSRRFDFHHRPHTVEGP
jgi:isopenicillin-N N-acyltransferase-like protein